MFPISINGDLYAEVPFPCCNWYMLHTRSWWSGWRLIWPENSVLQCLHSYGMQIWTGVYHNCTLAGSGLCLRHEVDFARPAVYSDSVWAMLWHCVYWNLRRLSDHQWILGHGGYLCLPLFLWDICKWVGGWYRHECLSTNQTDCYYPAVPTLLLFLYLQLYFLSYTLINGSWWSFTCCLNMMFHIVQYCNSACVDASQHPLRFLNWSDSFGSNKIKTSCGIFWCN